MGTPGLVTIGVAIPVPEPYGSMLRDAREYFGDDQAKHIPTHVTLLPPTPVRRALLADIDTHLRHVAAHAAMFCIELRGTDSFRPVSDVVFIPLMRGAGACTALATAVRQGPLSRDLDFSYHPHVTIAHDTSEAQLDAAETGMRWTRISFDVPSFALYERADDGAWSHVRDYALAPIGEGALTGVWGRLAAPGAARLRLDTASAQDTPQGTPRD